MSAMFLHVVYSPTRALSVFIIVISKHSLVIQTSLPDLSLQTVFLSVSTYCNFLLKARHDVLDKRACRKRAFSMWNKVREAGGASRPAMSSQSFSEPVPLD